MELVQTYSTSSMHLEIEINFLDATHSKDRERSFLSTICVHYVGMYTSETHRHRLAEHNFG